jgi:hypothetical protein
MYLFEESSPNLSINEDIHQPKNIIVSIQMVRPTCKQTSGIH